MDIQQQFRELKRLFFPRWDRENLWKVSRTSRRRVHGRCDIKRRVIEIVVQYADPDEQDGLFIHEICHAVAHVGHGKIWQRRMEKAAVRADEIGRQKLAEVLRKQIVDYQEAAPLGAAYVEIRDALTLNPDLTFSQVKRWLANEYGLLVSEVCSTFRRAKKVFQQAQWEAQEDKVLRQRLLEKARLWREAEAAVQQHGK